jgi:hypothetical protein
MNFMASAAIADIPAPCAQENARGVCDIWRQTPAEKSEPAMNSK